VIVIVRVKVITSPTPCAAKASYMGECHKSEAPSKHLNHYACCEFSPLWFRYAAAACPVTFSAFSGGQP
jgi:hypothetical protein